MRSRSFLLSGLIGLAAAPLLAQPMRLTAPAEGEVLRPGSPARIEWQAGPGLDGDAEEWEAFLSIDGGRTFPIRLTPHLDLSIRSFVFLVPRVPTRDARLLLRYGDEREERSVDPGVRFEIAQPASVGAELPLEFPEPSLEPGEKARPEDRDDPGVVLWLEGRRDGGELRERVRAPSGPALASARRGAAPWLALAGPERPRFRLEPPPVEDGAAPALGSGAPAVRDPRPAASVRLRIHRFNE